MSMIAIVIAGAATNIALTPSTLSELAQLGVTSLALLRNDVVTAVVLDGWAFDFQRAERVVAALMGDADQVVQTLSPVVQMSVHAGHD